MTDFNRHPSSYHHWQLQIDGDIAKPQLSRCLGLGDAKGLLDLLRPALAAGRAQLVLAGCEAHVCLLQTALGLRDAGHDVWVVADACGSRAATSHAAAMARLAAAGATLVTTEMVGFEWLATAGHPAFRAWQALIR